MALHDVFRHISSAAVLEKIDLLHSVMKRLCEQKPRLAVAALNPHASDGGLFGNEEATIIAPAVSEKRRNAAFPSVAHIPPIRCSCATHGEFDGIVAMYHDQGHIPLKLLTGLRAVNISVGLPIVRTSVAHGTAYDIAGKGCADCAVARRSRPRGGQALPAARGLAYAGRKPQAVLNPVKVLKSA